MSDPGPTPLGPCEPYASLEDIDVDEICAAPEATVLELLVSASDVVWILLGRPKVGVCETTIYPCQKGYRWRRWTRDYPGHPCSGCGDEGAIKLDMPVVDVSEVVVDSVVLDPSEYALLDGCWLVRTNGGWPGGGREWTDFSITYSFGEAVSPLVRDATVEVAVDLWETRPSSGPHLPPGASSVSRQGISFSVDEEVERVARPGMNLPALTKAVALYNPSHQPFPSEAWSPDRAYTNRVVRTFS